MDLSIIVVSFNTKKLTLSCISAIENEGSKIEKEIIVIDNGSKDGSVEAIERQTVRLIKNADNLGFSKANNQGIEKAKGRYILLLNSDTAVKKGSLGKLLDFADKTEDAGVVGAKLLNRDGSVQPSCLHFPTIGKAIKQYWLGEKGLFDKYVPSGKKSVKVDSVVGAALLITPVGLKKAGELDERYFFYYEDIDYCRRIKKMGLNVYYLPSAEIIHYHGESGKDLAKDKDQWRRLIPSSKIYHGRIKHNILTFILWTGQKFRKSK